MTEDIVPLDDSMSSRQVGTDGAAAGERQELHSSPYDLSQLYYLSQVLLGRR